MKIQQILKQLTPARIKRANEEVQNVKLPPVIKKWVKEYQKVGEREDFIWKWLYRMFKIVQLPIIKQQYKESLCRIKVLITMFVALLDDIADKKKKITLLNELLKIPLERESIELGRLNPEEKKYLAFAKKAWLYIEKNIKKYPRCEEFKEIFNYDLHQVLNEMRYSCLVNNNLYLLNKTECWLYMPFNMVAFIYSGLDLMCSKEINSKTIGKIREIIWEAQKMARIGNWVSTWEREVYEDDFASGVFVYAIDSRVVAIDDLRQKNRSEIIAKIRKAKIERKLLNEWEQSYYKIRKLGQEIGEISLITRFLRGLEKLIILHLTSRGYK